MMKVVPNQCKRTIPLKNSKQPASLKVSHQTFYFRDSGVLIPFLKVVCHGNVLDDERRNFADVHKPGDIVQVDDVFHGPV